MLVLQVPRLDKRKGVLSHDLAHGLERIKIPVINEIDGTQLPDLTYIRYARPCICPSAAQAIDDPLHPSCWHGLSCVNLGRPW